MAKVLIAVSGLKGMLFASVEAGRRLAELQNEVVFCSPKNLHAFFHSYGLSFLQLPDFFSAEKNNSFPKKIIKKLAPSFQKNKRLKERIDQLYIDEVAELLLSENCDLLLCDPELHEVVLASYSISLKTVLISPWFYLPEREESPPLHLLSHPGVGEMQQKEWEQLKQQKKEKEKIWSKKQGAVSRKNALLQKAEELGFPIKCWKENLWPLPFVYEDFPCLSFTMREMEFFPYSGNEFQYVGPMVLTNRKQKQTDWVQALVRKKQQGKKIILVTISTMNNSPQNLLPSLIEVAKRNKDWEIVLRYDKPKNRQLIEIPTNLHLHSWLPQIELLEIADLSINHGGINTIHECLLFGVPMVTLPGNQHDQNGCAARCEYHGLAMLADLETLEETINCALDNSNEKVAEFRKQLNVYQEKKVFEQLVLQHLSVSK